MSKPFQIYTDASGYQLGAVLQQEGKPISLLYKEANGHPKQGILQKKENFLSIVEDPKRTAKE